MKNTPQPLLLVVYLCIYLLFFGCEKDPITKPNFANDALLFTNAAPLDLQQDEAQQVVFLVGEAVGAYLHLGVYASPPELINGEVVNSEAPLWAYFGAVTPGQRIDLADGTLREDITALDAAYFLCRPNDLYWAAWSWEETAHFVTFSSEKVNRLDAPVPRPDLTLRSVTRLGSNPADTFLQAGSEVRLLLDIANAGGLEAANIRYSIRQELIDGLPTDQPLGNIPVNGNLAEEVVFTIPETANFGDVFTFQLLFTSNECVDVGTTFSLEINSIKVALADVRLTRILFRPDGGIWDLCALPSFWDPDVYFEVFSPTSLLFQSSDIDDVQLDAVPYVVNFPNQTPPIPLGFDTLYRVEFWDDDVCFTDSDPDFIGATQFRPFDYRESRPNVLFDTTDRIITEIHLIWE
ncbi:MAG: hypothetical protein AAFN92_06460 [Bacteroidota bacterium]